MVSASVKTFDLCVRTLQGTEHQFRGIQRNEWQLLFNFISSKNLTVENVDSVRQGPAQHVSSLPLEELENDPHRPSRDSDDDSDPDFAMNLDEQDDDDEHESGSGSSSGAEMVDEGDISEPEATVREEGEGSLIPVHESPASHATKPGLLPSKVPKKRTKGNETTDGKKKRKKKDKNAPKKGLSAFMFYTQANRESVKKDNPGDAASR